MQTDLVGSAPLERLGWSPYFEEQFAEHAAAGLAPARVAVEHRGAYVVYAAAGEAWAEVSGRLRGHARGKADFPAVGDWVAVSPDGPDGRALVHAVLGRRTKFSRKVAWHETDEQVLAANLDVVFLVAALTRDFNVRRLERFLTLGWESGAQPVVLLTKSDLCAEVELRVLEAESVAFGVPVHPVSAVTGDGLDVLDEYLADNRTAVLLGSSGVGKSTLINRLAGEELMATHETRAGDDRGRHTTRHRELFALPGGGLVIDTPGIRELQLWQASDGIGEAFGDVEELIARCRFSDCRHDTEPGCAVRAALDDGTLDPERLDSYERLQRELRRLEVKIDKRLQAEERKERRAFARRIRQLPKKGR